MLPSLANRSVWARPAGASKGSGYRVPAESTSEGEIRLVVRAISDELERIPPNAAAARASAAETLAAVLARIAATAAEESAMVEQVAAATARHAALLADVDAAEATKVALLEAELVAADGALEALIDAWDAARAIPVDAPSAVVDAVCSKVNAALARASTVPQGSPIAEATLEFVPLSADASGLIPLALGTLRTAIVSAADISSVRVSLNAESSAIWADVVLSDDALRSPGFDALAAAVSLARRLTWDAALLPVGHRGVGGASAPAEEPADVEVPLKGTCVAAAAEAPPLAGSSSSTAAVRIVMPLPEAWGPQGRVVLTRLAVAGVGVTSPAACPRSFTFGIGIAAPQVILSSSSPGAAFDTQYPTFCIGEDGNLFVPSGASVRAFGPDGAPAWTLTAPELGLERGLLINSCAVDTPGRRFFAATSAGSICAVDLDTRRVLWAVRAAVPGLRGLLVLPGTGVLLASSFTNFCVLAFSTADGAQITTSPRVEDAARLAYDEETGTIFCCSWSGNGGCIATLRWHAPTRTLSVDSEKVQAIAPTPTKSRSVAIVRPQGGPARLVVGAFQTEEVVVHALPGLDRVGSFALPCEVAGLAADPRGQALAAVGVGNAVHVLAWPLFAEGGV